jgi:cell division protein FtsB
VEEVIPELVRGYDGAKSIIETSLISVLTKAIQELSQEVTALRAEVELLKE